MCSWFPQPSARMLILVLHFMSLKEGINFLGIIQPLEKVLSKDIFLTNAILEEGPH